MYGWFICILNHLALFYIVQQIGAIFERIVNFMIKAFGTLMEHALGMILAIGICPLVTIATIFQNGCRLLLFYLGYNSGSEPPESLILVSNFTFTWMGNPLVQSITL